MDTQTQKKVKEAVAEADRVVDVSESQVEGAPLAKVASQPLAYRSPSPLEIIRECSMAGKPIPIEEMKELVLLQERLDANAARKAFNIALAEFKRTRPKIVRGSKSNQFKVKRDGREVDRTYASREDIEKGIGECLAANGLSYGYGDAALSSDGKWITVPCIIEHVGGHSIRASVPMPTESLGGSSAQQKVGIAQTYAMRYSLIAVLGLTDVEDDTDGEDDPEKITEEQAIRFQERVEALHHAKLKTGAEKSAAFLKMYGVERFIDLPKARYAEADAFIRSAEAKS